MRILFLSEQLPYPLHDGGNLRTYHVLKALATRHEVTLVTHCDKTQSRKALTAFDGLCRVVAVPESGTGIRLGGNIARFGYSGRPLFVLKNRSQRLLREARRQLESEPFDVVHFSHLDTACYVCEGHWSAKTVFDTHNCLSAMASQFDGRTVGRTRAAVLAREARSLRRFEAEVCAAVDAVLVCSESDEKEFRQLCDSGHYHVIPNGVDTNYFSAKLRDEEQQGELVFTGAMGYAPNEQAALYFCRKILPRLHQQGISARVTFVGRGPSPRVKSLHNGTTIRVTGEVDDVRPYLRRAQVVVVPLRHGSGTRLKILEAFAMGKPVVSTRLGAEGIPCEHEREILLADDDFAFAHQLVRLLNDPTARRRIGQAAQRQARRQFDWAAIGEKLCNVYDQLAGSRLAIGTR